LRRSIGIKRSQQPNGKHNLSYSAAHLRRTIGDIEQGYRNLAEAFRRQQLDLLANLILGHTEEFERSYHGQQED
jgi:hypothetical protein